MVTSGLPRIGTLPRTSNKPPRMRQETACSHAPKVSLFSHQGIPLWGFQYQGPGESLGRQALWGVVHISKVWMCAHKFRY